MKRCCAILASLLLGLLAWTGGSAEDPPAGRDVAAGGVGPLRAALQDPEQAAAPGRALPGETVYEVDLGKVWKVSPEYFRKVFDGADDGEPTGLNAKIDLHIHGVIRTRWGPADMLFGSMARFFASSPVLLDREYAARRAILFD